MVTQHQRKTLSTSVFLLVTVTITVSYFHSTSVPPFVVIITRFISTNIRS